MNISIFLESTALKDAAGQMGDTIKCINDIQSAVSQIILGTSAVWQGRAAEQNDVNFRALCELASNYITDATGTKTALDEAVLAYDMTERAQNDKVTNLSTAGIF